MLTNFKYVLNFDMSLLAQIKILPFSVFFSENGATHI